MKNLSQKSSIKSDPRRGLARLVLFFNALGLAILLPACGNPSDTTEGSREPRVRAFHLKITHQDQAPKSIGGAWRRQLKVVDGQTPIAGVTVEALRYEGTEFQMIGTTDASGNLMDTKIHEHTQYRIGGEVLTEWKRAKRDLVWTSKLKGADIAKSYVALHEGGEIRVDPKRIGKEAVSIEITRLLVPKNQVATWNENRALRISASEVRVDGELRAFAEDCRDGRNANELVLRTSRMAGVGLLNWAGCAGERGKAGKAGAAGKDGTPGTRGGQGGRGGKVEIFVSDFEMKYSQIKADGGAGGLGGAGGKGGSAYTEHFDPPSERMLGRVHHPAGRKGADGKGGADGADGEIGINIKKRPR
ncbi:MAG TPA: hypothetical protein VM901_10400 [Bdellovibrionota bacterium]|nr:hypothetical protein [Bdellovibrionota bacterium]